MSAVESAVRSAVVRVGAPGEGYAVEDDGPREELWGSGFFIAPGWVLTSAHVVAKGRGAVWRGERVIGITLESGEKLTGELACGLPRPSGAEDTSSPWNDPDLALVRVPEPAHAPHPNGLWLSDRSALNSSDVQLFGYSSVLSRGSVDFVQVTGRASAGTGGPMMLEDAYLPPGCSGGPVVDRDRGSVIGVSKGRARDGQIARATPITALRRFCEAGPHEAAVWQEALRAHDRHHLERYLALDWSWPREQYVREQQRDPGGYASGFTAYDRAELFGRFAELPSPVSAGQVLEMVEGARRDVRRETYRLHIHAPRSWREGVGLLYDMHDGSFSGVESSRERERAAVVLYAARVCQALSAPGRGKVPRPRTVPEEESTGRRPDPLAELEAWVRNAAVTLPNSIDRELVRDILEPAAAVPGPRSSYADVLVEIDPDLYGTHPWRIKLVQEDGQVAPVRQNETGVPRAELERDIRAGLADAFDKGDIGEHLAAVDFMLPRALFDEPVEMWRAKEAGPDEPFSPHTLPLGHRRAVALRDRHRWMKAEPIPEWHQRWRVIKKGHMAAVPLCLGAPNGAEEGRHRTERETELAAYGRLRSAEPHAVAVHCARAGSGHGAVALGVALGAGYPVVMWRRCDEEHTDCGEFQEHAAGLLRSACAAGAPKSLRELVRDLRNRNAEPDDSRIATSRTGELVLLYDPPQGPQLADEPLRAPPLRP
ncbi:trypsin-like peptidase domain-containing protein [Streptomyces sp. WMMB 322]|uniref:VMAP-C domain-containing protein n=1 Tax=Streptomyces sp. WMMB 322 TaxID=1286821 RepID=UPI0006E18145|nr:trypsin-like peptidase domain-containing protein [Streptomyces sp. WMMB 322]